MTIQEASEVEIALVAIAALGAVMLAIRLRRLPDPELAQVLGALQSGPAEDPADLPCPWCEAPTAEEDPVCPSCGRHFGPLALR